MASDGKADETKLPFKESPNNSQKGSPVVVEEEGNPLQNSASYLQTN
jgi:hypothetical protein